MWKQMFDEYLSEKSRSRSTYTLDQLLYVNCWAIIHYLSLELTSLPANVAEVPSLAPKLSVRAI